MFEFIAKWFKESGISPINFYHDTNAFYRGGLLIIHNLKGGFLNKDELFLLIFVDDKAYLFSSLLKTKIGSSIICHQISKLKLKMHIWRDGKISKTEAVIFFFKKQLLIHEDMMIASTSDYNVIVNINGMIGKLSKGILKVPIRRCYDKALVTANITVDKRGFISFMNCFKHLGCFISYDLFDKYDRSARVLVVKCSPRTQWKLIGQSIVELRTINLAVELLFKSFRVYFHLPEHSSSKCQ